MHTWALQRRASHNGELYKSSFLFKVFFVLLCTKCANFPTPRRLRPLSPPAWSGHFNHCDKADQESVDKRCTRASEWSLARTRGSECRAAMNLCVSWCYPVTVYVSNTIVPRRSTNLLDSSNLIVVRFVLLYCSAAYCVTVESRSVYVGLRLVLKNPKQYCWQSDGTMAH